MEGEETGEMLKDKLASNRYIGSGDLMNNIVIIINDSVSQTSKLLRDEILVVVTTKKKWGLCAVVELLASF